MGHIFSQGVQVDPKKVEDMQYWPHPKILKRVSGLLGIIGNYRKFVKNYGKIVAPLTSLKKNAIFCNEKATKPCTTLKEVMCTTPISVVSLFNKEFFLDCDATGRVLLVVLI